MYCVYYQAQVEEKKVWFLVAILRSFEHLAFDRTLDKDKSIFEFFVPEDLEHYFLELMHAYQQEGVVTHFEKKENRLLDPHAQV